MLAGFLIIALIFFVPTENGELPIRARYPFDTTIPPWHTVAYLLQSCAVTVGLISITVMDNIALGLCKWLKVQLTILSSNYEHCTFENCSQRAYFNLHPCKPTETRQHGETIIKRNVIFPINSNVKKIRCFIPFELTEANGQDNEARTDCFVRRFKICVKHHQRLINIVEEMNALFSSSMLAQLFASSSMICLTGFQAVLVSV